MNQLVGFGALTIGFTASICGFAGSVYGLVTNRKSVMRLIYQWSFLVATAAVIAFVVMEIALFQRDFTLDYVRTVGSSTTPALFNFAALWSSLEGSLLLWILMIGIFMALTALKYRSRRTDPVFGWAMAIMFLVSAFFFALVVGPANPFVSSPIPEGFVDGPGPNPLLQNHILVAFHPPFLYIGYVGFTVPFAFGIATLITGRIGEDWLALIRRWTLVAWAALTFGIVLGAWWSYEVLGWGGFWAWDPVENASILPWLTATAYIHSVMIQDRRAMLRIWNTSLLVATFALTIFGTFLTRSGVFESVHAFSESTLGPWLLGFFGVITLTSVGLIGWRGDSLASDEKIESFSSRESMFLLNNFVFGAIAFVIILGTTFPLVAELVDGTQLTIARPYFDSMTRPLGLLILFLMALAPFTTWKNTNLSVLFERLSGPVLGGLVALMVTVFLGGRGFWPLLTFWLGGFAGFAALKMLYQAVRASGIRGLLDRRGGGMIVHIGVVLLAVGLAASESYRVDQVVALSAGDSVEVAGESLTYVGSGQREDDRTQQSFVSIQVDNGRVFEPAVTRYRAVGTIVPTPSVATGLDRDVYLVVDETPTEQNGPIRLRVVIRPLVAWLWIGGTIMVLGSLIALIRPSRKEIAVG